MKKRDRTPSPQRGEGWGEGARGAGRRRAREGVAASEDVTHDTLLGGRVALLQPCRGYRVAIDPVLLAAAVAARPGEEALDLGCGVGAAALCLAARLPEVRLAGIEVDPGLVQLALKNVALNRLADRFILLQGDAFARRPPLAPEVFDHVLVNPPYLEGGDADPSPNARKARATVEAGAGLADWVATALRTLKPKGSVTFIHRADRLADLLAVLRGKAGGIAVLPLWPKAGEPARRVIVQARKGSRAPLSLLPGLVLHEADGGYTTAAQAVLAGGAALPLG